MPPRLTPNTLPSPEPSEWVQRVGGMARLPGLLQELGVDVAAVLEDCAVPPDILEDPERRLPFAQVGELLQRAATRTDIDHFGLLLGQRLDIGTLGLRGETARHAPTVGAALSTVAEHHRIHTRACLIFLSVDGDRATFGYSIYDPATAGAAHIHDGVAAWMLNTIRSLTHLQWVPDQIRLARGRPASLSRYRRILPARLEFDAEFTGLVFDRSVLERRPPAADPERFERLERQVIEQGRRSLLNDLRRALRIEMIRGGALSDRVAHTLDVHRRTLHRRLRQEGTSFRQVLDEIRYDTARHMLQLTDMPLLQVATSLGYSDITAFTRAFKRWSGASPGRYRDDNEGAR